MLTEKDVQIIEKSIKLAAEAQQMIKDKDQAQSEYLRIHSAEKKDHFKILALLFGVFVICCTHIMCVEIKESYSYSQEIDIKNTSESKSIAKQNKGGTKNGNQENQED